MQWKDFQRYKEVSMPVETKVNWVPKKKDFLDRELDQLDKDEKNIVSMIDGQSGLQKNNYM